MSINKNSKSQMKLLKNLNLIKKSNINWIYKINKSNNSKISLMRFVNNNNYNNFNNSLNN
jgi:hypothetical protein